MPALDTNILVRHVVGDDPAQLTLVRRLIRQAIEDREGLFVPVTVVMELEWVLRSSYGCSKDEVIRVVSNLFSAAELSFESDHALEVALQLYRDGAADFADCVHVSLAAQAGEQPLWTFDRRAAQIKGARLLAR